MDEYVRYGEEWKQEMMRNKKEDIVRMFSEAMKEKEEYAEQKCSSERARIRNKLTPIKNLLAILDEDHVFVGFENGKGGDIYNDEFEKAKKAIKKIATDK